MEKESEKLSAENLKEVSGGDAQGMQKHIKCPQCGKDIMIYRPEISDKYICPFCGYEPKKKL